MLDLITLLWQFLRAQPLTQMIALVSWHLLALLAVLGVLSAFGLHFLIGHVFGFYRRKERLARWVAWPTLLVLLVSLQVLLGSYLLGVRAEELVRANLTTGVLEQLGRLLLEPAFGTPALAVEPAEGVNKDALKTALRASSELDYRSQLVSRLVPPGELAPASDGAGPRGPDVLVQIGLRWVTEPHNVWFQPAAPSGSPPAGQPGAPPQPAPGAAQGNEPFFLPDFLISLVDELPEGTVLPRLDWEHVAGTRYVDGVLRPLMDEYLSYLATALAVLVLLLDAVYFLLLRRLKRIGQPRPAKPKAPPKPGPLPAPAKGSAPDLTPAKPGAAAASTAAAEGPAAGGATAPPAASGTEPPTPAANAERSSGD